MGSHDLIIVGGGIVGSFAAWFARRAHPHWRIAVVEARAIGTGATRYSAGVHLATGSSPHIRALAARSAQVYAELETLGLPPAQPGLDAFWIAPSASLAALNADASGFTIAAADAERRRQFEAAYPPALLGADESLMCGGTARRFDPPQIARQLLHQAGGVGLDLYEGVRIAHIEARAGGSVLTTGLGQSLRARRTLLCNGPWLAGTLGGRVATALGLRIKKVAAMHLATPHHTGPGCAVFLPASDAYLVPLQGRAQHLFSFASQAWDCDPDGREIALSADDHQVAEAILARHFGDWRPAIRGGRVFCDTYAADRQPIARMHPDWPGVAIAGAGGGAGFRLAPAIAERAVQLLTEEVC